VTDPRHDPAILCRMLDILAREIVGWRRQAGDANCEADEVLKEAHVQAQEEMTR
jgi:hypothetical protein